MNQIQFIDEVIRPLIRDSAFKIVLSDLNGEPNSKLPDNVQEASCWYKTLSAKEQSLVQAIVKKTIHSAVFRFLVCLDGAKVIDDADGALSLFYGSEDEPTKNLLANINAEYFLHDLFMEDYPSWIGTDSE